MIFRLALAILSGIALVLAFPPFGAGFLAWGALVPLFFSLDGVSRRTAFLLGSASGLAFYLGTVYWVIHSMYNFGGVPLGVSILVMLSLVLYLSLYAGVFALLVSVAAGFDRLAKVMLFPAFWVMLEYLRGHLFTGFPWVLLGYTQSQYLPLIQISDITGVWGVSYLIAAFNAAAFFVLRHLVKKEERVPLLPAGAAIALLSLTLVYGMLRMNNVDKEVSGWSAMKVGIAQGSIDQSVKWDGGYQQKTLDIYKDLTTKAGLESARLVIWPETAIPFYFEAEKIKDGFIGSIMRDTGTYVLTGSPSYNYNPVSGEVSYYNSAYLLSPAGEALGRYDKIHLVPFGEYVPLRSILPFKKLTAGVGDFNEGPGPVPIMFEGGGIGTLVCFESIFPEIARGAVKNGATMLANLTNDAWFGYTSAPYQHFGMAVFRAVENKSYLVRAANTGISAVIDPNGRIRKETRLFERTVIVDEIRLRQGGLTFYSRYGDAFAWACAAISGAFILTRLRRRN